MLSKTLIQKLAERKPLALLWSSVRVHTWVAQTTVHRIGLIKTFKQPRYDVVYYFLLCVFKSFRCKQKLIKIEFLDMFDAVRMFLKFSNLIAI